MHKREASHLLTMPMYDTTALHILVGGNTLCLKDESSLFEFKNDLVSAQHSAAQCRRNLVDDRIESERVSCAYPIVRAIIEDKFVAVPLRH